MHVIILSSDQNDLVARVQKPYFPQHKKSEANQENPIHF